MHPESHALAGKTVKLNSTAKDPLRGVLLPDVEFDVEDWYDYQFGRGGGHSWTQDQTFTTMHYFDRANAVGLPLDDEVIYGKVHGLGHIVHVSELDDSVIFVRTDEDGTTTLHGATGAIELPTMARVSEEVGDTDVFEVVFHGAMRHAFQAWIDEHPSVMLVRTPQEMRRDEEGEVDGYHEYLVVPSLVGYNKAADAKTSAAKIVKEEG
jgi:hypothetical protein